MKIRIQKYEYYPAYSFEKIKENYDIKVGEIEEISEDEYEELVRLKKEKKETRRKYRQKIKDILG